MNEDTTKLLEEITSGCKMAIESMNQVEGFIQDNDLLKVVSTCREEHEKLEGKAAMLLTKTGEPEKKPNPMASAFSWFTAEMKLMMKNDNHQVAKIMMDGCNMGIQSLSEYKNKYTEASNEAQNIAKEIIKVEEDFMKELKNYV